MGVGEVVRMKEKLGRGGEYVKEKKWMRVMVEKGVIGIVKEKDRIWVREVMLRDNEEVWGVIGWMMDGEVVIMVRKMEGM